MSRYPGEWHGLCSKVDSRPHTNNSGARQRKTWSVKESGKITLKFQSGNTHLIGHGSSESQEVRER